MEFESLLFTALASPYGIVVTTSSPESLRAKLYPLRKKDPALACLHFLIPSNPTSPALWIVKKSGASQ